MGDWPAIDSRQYVVAFDLRSKADCPPDFELPATLTNFDTGLFLPRGGSDWFGRPSYPPRILLLAGGALHIISHPSAGEAPRQCAMEQISSVESGQMLLKGWLRFTGSGFDYTVRYNTRGFRPVSQFMRSLRDKLLHGALPPGASEVQPGAGLDIKFANALERELDAGETVVTRVFQPPRAVRSRSWGLPYRHWIAGDLLALTGRRLLWITDRERGFRWRYGSIVSYAPLDAVQSIGPTPGRGGQLLHVNLSSGSAWQVPIASESPGGCQRVAEDFEAALEIQKRRNGNKPNDSRRAQR